MGDGKGCCGIIVIVYIACFLLGRVFDVVYDGYKDNEKVADRRVEQIFENINDVENFRLSLIKYGTNKKNPYTNFTIKETKGNEVSIYESYDKDKIIGSIDKRCEFEHFFAQINGMLLVRSKSGVVGYINTYETTVKDVTLHRYGDNLLSKLAFSKIFKFRFADITIYILLILSIISLIVSFIRSSSIIYVIANMLMLIIMDSIIVLYGFMLYYGYTGYWYFETGSLWYSIVNGVAFYFIMWSCARLSKTLAAMLSDSDEEYSIFKLPSTLAMYIPLGMIIFCFFTPQFPKIPVTLGTLLPSFLDGFLFRGDGGFYVKVCMFVASSFFLGIIFYTVNMVKKFKNLPLAIIASLLISITSVIIFISFYLQINILIIPFIGIVMIAFLLKGASIPSAVEYHTHNVEIRERFTGRVISRHKGYTSKGNLGNDKPDRII